MTSTNKETPDKATAKTGGGGNDDEQAISFSELLFTFSTTKDKALMAAGTVGGVVHGLTLLLFYEGLLRLFDDLTSSPPNELQGRVNDACLLLFIAGIVAFVSSFVQGFCWRITTMRQVIEMRRGLFRATIHQSIGSFSELSPAKLHNLMTAQCAAIDSSYNQKFGALVPHAIRVIGGLIWGLIRVWRITIAFFLLVPIAFACVKFMSLVSAGYTVAAVNAQRRCSQYVAEVLHNLRIVQLHNQEKGEVREYGRSLGSKHRAVSAAEVARNFARGFGGSIMYLFGYGAIIMYGGYLRKQNLQTTGEIMAVMMMVFNMLHSLATVAMSLGDLFVARRAAYPVVKVVREYDAYIKRRAARCVRQEERRASRCARRGSYRAAPYAGDDENADLEFRPTTEKSTDPFEIASPREQPCARRKSSIGVSRIHSVAFYNVAFEYEVQKAHDQEGQEEEEHSEDEDADDDEVGLSMSVTTPEVGNGRSATPQQQQQQQQNGSLALETSTNIPNVGSQSPFGESNEEDTPSQQQPLGSPTFRFSRRRLAKNASGSFSSSCMTPQQQDDPNRHRVLEDVNLRLLAGESVAIVGPTGSGKSTIVGMLLRFLEPSSGKILINDAIDFSSLSKHSLYPNVGYVPQEPLLFHDTVLENVRVGMSFASDEQVHEACREAHVHDAIMALPNAYQTQCGGSGTTGLSGGERQRLSFARALLRNPAVWILDEPTSSLDPQAEAIVNEVIAELMADPDKIVIVITHRPAILEHATHVFEVCPLNALPQGATSTPPRRSGSMGMFAGASTRNDVADDNDGAEGKRVVHTLVQVDTSPNSPFTANLKQQKASGGSAATYSAQDLADVSSGHEKQGDAKKKDDQPTGDYAAPATTTHAPAEKENEMEGQKPKGNNTNSGQEFGIVTCVTTALGQTREHARLLAALLGSAVYAANFPLCGLALGRSTYLFGQPVLPSDYYEQVGLWVGVVVIMSLCVVFGNTLEGFYVAAGESACDALRESVMRQVLRRSPAYFVKRPVATIISALGNDSEDVHHIFRPSLGAFVRILTALAIALGICFSYTTHFTLVAIGVCIFCAIGGFFDDTISTPRALATDPMASVVVYESMAYIHTVKVYCMENSRIKKFNDFLAREVSQRTIALFVESLGYGFANFCYFGAYATLYWYSTRLIVSGDASVLDALVVSNVMYRSGIAIGEGLSHLFNFSSGLAGMRGLLTLAAEKKADDEEDESEAQHGQGFAWPFDKTPGGVDIGVQLNGAKYSYTIDDGTSDDDDNKKPTTKKSVHAMTTFDATCEFPVGTHTAVVGPSGSGKTTLLTLLTRQETAQGGAITLTVTPHAKHDSHTTENTESVEVNFYDVPLRVWRDTIAYVPQDGCLFNRTIYENITYGCEETNGGDDALLINENNECVHVPERVERAAKTAGLYETIAQLPEGYLTVVGHLGRKLSGGQRQRLAIARAVYRQPRVLFLDEITSALDSRTTEAVMLHLSEFQRYTNTTLVNVAHSKHVADHAERTLVMSKGSCKLKGAEE